MENNVAASTSDNKDILSLLPHLESLERMLQLPVVGAAWQQSQDVYEKVKTHNRMFNWAFSTAEDAVQFAVTTAAPIVSKFDRPIHFVDQTLVKGIDKLEVGANKVIGVVQPRLEKVCALRICGQRRAATLKDLSWQKANEVLATQYGSIAVNGVDQTSALAERLLDYYFPGTESDAENDDAPISAADDPVLHTVQTVGRLSNKVSRRVYRSVSRQIKNLKKEDVHDYVASLIAVLRLTQYLNFINERVQSQCHCNDNQANESKCANNTSTPLPEDTSYSPPSPPVGDSSFEANRTDNADSDY